MSGAYAESYTYNEIGNMLSKGGVGYEYLDPLHKHAVTTLNGEQKFWYDANGNMTRRDEGSVTWTHDV